MLRQVSLFKKREFTVAEHDISKRERTTLLNANEFGWRRACVSYLE